MPYALKGALGNEYSGEPVHNYSEKSMPTVCSECHGSIPDQAVAYVLNGSPICIVCHDETAPKCPYCNGDLDKRPKRSSECPHCESTYFVRTKQTIWPSSILTEGQRVLWDALDALEDWQITFADARMLMDRYKQKTTHEKLYMSVADSLYDLAFQRHGPSMQLHYQMASYLRSRGRDGFQHDRAGAICSLRHSKIMGVKRVEVSISTAPCSECKKLNGLTIAIDDAISNPPVPCPSCTDKVHPDHKHGWCKCAYSDILPD